MAPQTGGPGSRQLAPRTGVQGPILGSGRRPRTTVCWERSALLSQEMAVCCLMRKCSRALHPRQYPGNSHFLYSLPPLSLSLLLFFPSQHTPELPGFIFWFRLPHLPWPPLLFRIWELEAPFPNHHVGRDGFLLHSH